jgi:ankyrin repeat protein
VALAVDTYPDESKAQKDEWGGRTALHCAVAGLEVDIAAKLLDIGEYDVLAKDHNKQTSLHVAATKGDAQICELLLQNLDKRSQIFGVDAADCFGRTALHTAVIHGHEAIAGVLVNAGASTELRCERGYNALLYACKCNRLGILIALYTRNSEIARDLLATPAGEHGLFIAARCGAFQIVRWLLSVCKEELVSPTGSYGFGDMKCLQQRSLLHYAAAFGDHGFIRLHLQQMAAKESQNPGDMESQLNIRDKAGYTPLLYAFAFGRVQALLTLVEYGSNSDMSVDHLGEAKTHPYASSFNIGTLLQWFAFPGWYSYTSKMFPQRDKCRVTKQESIHEDYLMNSSFRRWKTRRKTRAMVFTRSRSQANNVKTKITKAKSGAGKFENIRTSMRSWRFPQLSLFDFVCDVGDSVMVDFVVNMKVPLLLRRSTYQSQRRNMLQAVRWNRLDVVQLLISADASTSGEQIEATNHTDGLHYLDFLEVGIDCAVSRGHEDIAIYLLTRWDDVRESGRKAVDAGMFAFQFAHVLHIACIRRMTKLIEYMVSRGGEQLVAFHANDGSALVYAVAWGHMDVAALLAAYGAHFSSMDTYIAPSVKKWVEFGCRQEIQLSWCLDTVVSRATLASTTNATKVSFEGPIREYEAPEERLDMDTICNAFGNHLTLDAAEPTHLHDKPSEEAHASGKAKVP